MRDSVSFLRKWEFVVVKFLFIFFTLLSIAHAKEPLQLSLKEAILLAVRDHPNVQTAQLNYVQQKFNLHIQEWQFKPHYNFQTTLSTSQTIIPGTLTQTSRGLNPQLTGSLLTPIGTQLSLISTNNITGHYNPGLSLQIIQPLIRGFGRAVVESALYNAMDSEKIARLNMEGTLRSTVTSVINAYLESVSAKRFVQIDEETLRQAEDSVTQTKLFIKAGRKAGNELVTVQASVASARTQLENDKNNLNQSRYALLEAIGIDPNSEINFTDLNLDPLIKRYHLPACDEVKQLTLLNDIQYQTDSIALHGSTTRNVLVANDSTRWQLNLSVNATVGSGVGGGLNAGTNSLLNGENQAKSAMLTLQIPIDDQLAKQAVMNAKIALKQAELALLQEKWNKQTSAINGWNNVVSVKRALVFAADAEKLQERTYQLSYQKYLHGLIDGLELQSAQLQLTKAKQALLNARMSYLKALVNLDLLTGNTLKTWDIQVRR